MNILFAIGCGMMFSTVIGLAGEAIHLPLWTNVAYCFNAGIAATLVAANYKGQQ